MMTLPTTHKHSLSVKATNAMLERLQHHAEVFFLGHPTTSVPAKTALFVQQTVTVGCLLHIHTETALTRLVSVLLYLNITPSQLITTSWMRSILTDPSEPNIFYRLRNLVRAIHTTRTTARLLKLRTTHVWNV